MVGSDRQPPRWTWPDQTVQPGDDGLYDLASASNDLPVPLLLALIALGLLAVTGAAAWRCAPDPGARAPAAAVQDPDPACPEPTLLTSLKYVIGAALAGVAFGAAGGSELSRTTIVELLLVIAGGAIVAAAIAWGGSGGRTARSASPCSPRWPPSPRCR